MSIDVKFNRVSKTYHPGEKVTGVVVVSNRDSATKHAGINLTVEGNVSLQLSARSVGIFEAFYSSVKPQPLIYYEIPVSPAAKVPEGVTEIPFEFVLKPLTGSQLHDTYHGVYVNVRYSVAVEMPRGMLSSTLKEVREFFVELNRDPEVMEAARAAKPFKFRISPESLLNVKESSKKKIPEFLFEGHLNRVRCAISEAFEGEIIVKKCPVNIRSIELQLVRVETCNHVEGETREATEIQNIQIADGNAPRNLAIPIHMVFPRLFTCCTTVTKQFKVEFEVNLIVLFEGDHMVTENFPILLYR